MMPDKNNEIFDACSDSIVTTLLYEFYRDVRSRVINMRVGDKKKVYKIMCEARNKNNITNTTPSPNNILPVYGISIGDFCVWQVLEGK